MKLRNKRTGKIVELEKILFKNAQTEDLLKWKTYEPNVNSITELNEEWEDYKPVEPIIEDPKARKVFREWAEIYDIKTVLVCESFNSWGFKNKNNSEPGDKEYMTADLLFRGEKPEELEFNKEYTVTELCGEEE